MSGDASRKCAKGHVMDPNWDSCPYCEAEERSAQKSCDGNAGGKPTVVLNSVEPEDHSARRTIVGDLPQPPSSRETIVMSSDASPEAPGGSPAKDTRKIVGALVTYSWVPGGQIFPIREGKNYIGSAGQNCDVHMPQDAKMSGVHALILCRSGKNELIDQQSSNGTFLNGEILSSNQAVDLTTNVEIKTGSTLWFFVKIEAPLPC